MRKRAPNTTRGSVLAHLQHAFFADMKDLAAPIGWVTWLSYSVFIWGLLGPGWIWKSPYKLTNVGYPHTGTQETCWRVHRQTLVAMSIRDGGCILSIRCWSKQMLFPYPRASETHFMTLWRYFYTVISLHSIPLLVFSDFFELKCFLAQQWATLQLPLALQVLSSWSNLSHL